MIRHSLRNLLALVKATAVAAAVFTVVLAASPDMLSGWQGQQGIVSVDTVIVEGASQRVQAQSVSGIFGIQAGSEITYRDIQRGIKALHATGQFSDIVVRARGTSPVELVVQVEEYPRVRSVQINGLESLSARQVRDTTNLEAGFPVNRQRILDAKAYVRQELSSKGIPFAQIEERLVPVPDGFNEVDLILDVIEGQRVTVSRVDFIGNEGIAEDELHGAMSTKSEGFWWFRSGAFEASMLRVDLEENLPQFYGSQGYLDFQVISDTVIVDPNTGKSILRVQVDEGEQYRLGSFRVNGNTQFTTEELEILFEESGGGIFSSLGFGGGDSEGVGGQVFDAAKFNEAILTAEEQYRNEGYLYIQINPVIDRRPGTDDESPIVDAVWEVVEGAPALVNRIAIIGNEYTYEWVIRNQIFVLPGDVYSQTRVLRSYQNISSLGFFEAPMPFPDIQPNEDGDVDITFNVVEKQTGSINFGTSMGGGYGLSGFVGYQQPNLFGQAKSGSLRWDFGRYLNSFEASYTDPALFQSLLSGSLSLFNSRDRFFQFSTGRRSRLGASTRVGFPWPNSRVSRVFLGYSISRTKYELFTDVEDTSLFGRPPGLQSQLSLTLTRQTLDHPLFPTVGSRQNVVVEFNGGLLGGSGDFTKILTEANWWLPVGSMADGDSQPQGPRFALGLTLRAGSVFGDAGAFPFDRFWMGGVQFGQNLRGYDETSITPQGFVPEGRAGGVMEIERLGDAFFSFTAEYALRMSDQFGISLFYDAGNVWREPSDIDPTRLFRGAGIAAQVVTPFGPIGLDYAYGFDKPEPGWQLHFRLGQGL